MKSPVSDLSQGFSLTVGESTHSVGDLASLSSLEVGCRATIWLDLAAPADLHSPLCTCFLQLPLKSPYAFSMCLAIVPRRLGAIGVKSLLSLMLALSWEYRGSIRTSIYKTAGRISCPYVPTFPSARVTAQKLLYLPRPCSLRLSWSHWHPDHVSAVPISETGDQPCEPGKPSLPP